MSHYETKKNLISSQLNNLFNTQPLNFESACEPEKLEKDIDGPKVSTNNAQAKSRTGIVFIAQSSTLSIIVIFSSPLT